MESGIKCKPKQGGMKRKCSKPLNTMSNKRFSTRNNFTDRILTEVNSNVQCELCHQLQTEDVTIPLNAEPEFTILKNEKFANTDECNVIHHKVTNFSIYDENKHLCFIDSGIMERNVSLYFTGYIKPIDDIASSIEDEIVVKEIGPILEWWLSSYECGSQVILGVSTKYTDYLLIEPHSSYKKYMISITEKTHLSRLVIKSIVQCKYDEITYGDVLNCIVNSVSPITKNKFTEDDLIIHAQFILDQVADYDSNNIYCLSLGETQFIETLIQLSGVTKPILSKRYRRGQRIGAIKTDINIREFSKATTTELVKDLLDNMLLAELDINDKNDKNITYKLIATVFNNLCNEKIENIPSIINDKSIGNNQVIWKGHKLCKKMFVLVKHDLAIPLIGRIEYFCSTKVKVMAHIKLFMHGYETVLGETSDPQEIFALNKCTYINIKNICKILCVTQKQPKNDWFNLGNSKLTDLLEPVDRNIKNSFFYQLEYDDEYGRFNYPKLEDTHNEKYDFCSSCKVKNLKKIFQKPSPTVLMKQDDNRLLYKGFKLYKKLFNIGDFVYLQPGIFSRSKRTTFINAIPFVHKESNKNKNTFIPDKSIYTEYYRKELQNTMCGSNETTPKPFEIGEILSIYIVDGDPLIHLNVRRMYRAENIPFKNVKNLDMNMLFWSEEEFNILSNDVYGKCFVSYMFTEKNLTRWSTKGPDRFYFKNKYDFLTGTIILDYQFPWGEKSMGAEVHVKNDEFVNAHKMLSYCKIEPLRGLDIFAGCGGLSKGLEDSGLVKCKWAIESDVNAAAAFKLNNPHSHVIVRDCNLVLKIAMSGVPLNKKNQCVPNKGDIDFICGSPPCQGLSGMNRFNFSQYSLFKNSLIVSFLSYVDYYRPKFFVMENVRNFESFKRSMVLRITLRCIIRMGYQCAFGNLQAGNFGVPQARKRLIIIAAAPGEQLPLFPEPTHVFNRKESFLGIKIGGKTFRTNCQYGKSAPMRSVTVYDVWSDLPHIPNGANDGRIQYKTKPITHMQRLLRYPNGWCSEPVLIDHICKNMPPLVQARMKLMPLRVGSDWRDLPNIEIQLCNGIKTNKLLYYSHKNTENGKDKIDDLCGVCECANGNKCNPLHFQVNTIIPWCLPHTGNRHNNWPGLYGRLAWTEFCSTTIIHPEPMGNQGRVIHPVDHRVVSVRECARAQGFYDSFKFCGSIIDKHHQIGDAVPPLMAAAIGHEIVKAVKKRAEFVLIKKKALL